MPLPLLSDIFWSSGITELAKLISPLGLVSYIQNKKHVPDNTSVDFLNTALSLVRGTQVLISFAGIYLLEYDAEVWCFLWSAAEQTVKQTIKLPVI